MIVDPAEGEGVARKASLALSKLGETVRTSRAKRRLGGVRGVVKECGRAKTGVPEKSLSVRSRLDIVSHDAHAHEPCSNAVSLRQCDWRIFGEVSRSRGLGRATGGP